MIRAGGGRGLGFSQIPQAPIRAAGVNYQNTTGRPIFVSMSVLSLGVGASGTFLVDDVNPAVFTVAVTTFSAIGVTQPLSYVIPPGFFYRLDLVNAIVTFWAELR